MERIWKKPFKPVMQTHSQDIAGRTGLSELYPTED